MKHNAIQTNIMLGDARRHKSKVPAMKPKKSKIKMPLTDEQAQWYLERNPVLALALLES